MYSRAAMQEMLDDAPDLAGLEARLVPIHRVLQRWAVSIGDGLPAEQWDDRRISKPPPLDDATAIVVDQLILKSPPPTQRLIREWYKTPTPTYLLAKKRRMSRRGLQTAWRLSLHFMRHRFEDSRHTNLLTLIKINA